MRLLGSAALLLVLSAVAVIGADEWGWLPLEDGLQGEEKVREKRQDIGVLPASQQNVTEVSDEDILKFILDSGRQGRSLEGFDEVYSDPSVQDALQNADDAQARNIIKDKLCSLGLMQCDGQGESIEGKRPYYPIYAQQQPPRPRPPVRGPPLPPQQYAQRPPQPPQQQAYPPKPQHQGPYGPPKPMPVPNHAQHKIGYAGPQQRPPYSGPPNSFAGPSYASAYPSKPLGPIYEGDTPPFEFEPIGAGEKIYESPLSKPGLVLNEGPLVKPVEQHIHHHYHHIDGAADSKTVVVNNPGPVGASVLSGSAVVGGSSSSSFNSGLYSAGGVYGGAQGLSGGGFSPLAGSDFDYKELKGVNNNNGFGQSGVYAAQSKPVFEGSSSSFGQGGQSSLYNQGPAQFGSNSLYSGESSSAYQGGNGAGFHSSNPALYKKELNVKGPAASNGLGTYSGNNYSKYSQYANGQYAANGGQFGSSGGQFGANGGQQFGANGGQQFGANGGQFGANGGQYSQFANGNGIEDCVCVPYDQCPAQDVIGRKDDLILPLDPRNLKTDIEAAADEVVITDGNGTMTVVRVPKNATAEPETKTKKISKREAAEGKSNEAKDKASIEPSVPTPAPGHAQGSPTISFPSSRRRRRATDVSVPESLEEGQETVKQIEEPVAVEPSSVQEKSFSTEKRQAYYGPRPGQQQQQCSGRQVCCRKPVYRNPASQNLGKCGVRNAQGINGRIKNPVYVDGDSEFGEYPWQVAILKKDPKESVYVCGGTLIDNLYIITAAHCVKTYNGFDLRVRLGEWDVNHDVEFYPYIERDIISVQVHPEYYAGTLDNDLAILKMDRPVDLTSAPHIAPACLPDKHTDFSGQRCWTTGWGKDAFGDYGKYQNILKEVDVPIVNHYQCQNQLRQTRLGYTYNLNQGFICAGGEEGKDACKGDGGGPLVCERNGVWQVVGVVSWGIGCGQANVPGVYVKVAHYLDWINQVRGRF
uniref:Phenoloxidase-activating factor 2 n=1 Tax=Anopheles coluzzii TaxID=1518534 RepID=A0A6E8VR47_ANOCL